MALWIAVLAGAAALAPVLGRRGAVVTSLLALAPAAVLVVALGAVLGATSVSDVAWAWVPSMGVELSLAWDGLAALFTLLIAGIGAVVIVYAAFYAKARVRGRLVGLLLAFMAAMLGLVLAGDLITLFIFWEATSVTSYFLIGFDASRPQARAAARKALLVTGGGGLALLVGSLLMAVAMRQGGATGAAALSLASLDAEILRDHALYPAIVVLIFLAAFTKSAQIPFEGWLLGAMSAPAPASAYLHSATMVKAGIYLVARLDPALGGTLWWSVPLLTFGGLTAVVMALRGVARRDLKQLLACSTASVLGALFLLLGVGSPAAVGAAIALLIAHALYKSALFLVAGTVDKATGARDIGQLQGLARPMPLLAAAAGAAAASMIGAPPLLGFIAKESALASLLAGPSGGLLLLTFAVAAIGLVTIALLVALRPFWGAAAPAVSPVSPVSSVLSLAPLLLAACGLVLGPAAGWLDVYVASPAAAAIEPTATPVGLALWHGASPGALALLAGSVAIAGLGYLLYRRIRRQLAEAPRLRAELTPATTGASRMLDALAAAARRVALSSAPRRMDRQVAVLFAVGIGLVAVPVTMTLMAGIVVNGPAPGLLELALAGCVLGATVGVIRARSQLGGIIALGLVGLALALLFGLSSAPDLALTLLVVEAVTVVFFALLFYLLPPPARRSSRPRRLRDALIGVGAGVMVTALTLASSALHLPATVSEELGRRSVPEAGGANVVNVILVDFRALDTLAETVVVAIAALGAYALLGAPHSRRKP